MRVSSHQQTYKGCASSLIHGQDIYKGFCYPDEAFDPFAQFMFCLDFEEDGSISSPEIIDALLPRGCTIHTRIPSSTDRYLNYFYIYSQSRLSVFVCFFSFHRKDHICLGLPPPTPPVMSIFLLIKIWYPHITVLNNFPKTFGLLFVSNPGIQQNISQTLQIYTWRAHPVLFK